MRNYLCVSIRWIGDRFHGVSEDLVTREWPPSPFRLFQALVAGACRYGESAASELALNWLEQQPGPTILAPSVTASIAFDHFVPDNDNSFSHRRSDIRRFNPSILGRGNVVHYVWPVLPNDPFPFKELSNLTTSLSALGWGIDQAYATAKLLDEDEISAVSGIRWQAVRKSESPIDSFRVPISGSLSDLRTVHQKNAVRTKDQRMRLSTRKPKVFDRILYTSTERPVGRPYRVFKFLDGKDDRYPHAKLMHIAGMARHAAIKAMMNYPPPDVLDPEDWVNRVVRGKRDPTSEDHKQFSQLFTVPPIFLSRRRRAARNIWIR